MKEWLSLEFWHLQTLAVLPVLIYAQNRPAPSNHWSTHQNINQMCFLFKKRIILWMKVKVAQSCLTLCNPMDYTVHGNSLGQNTGVSSLSLLQGIFLTQELNQGLLHCGWILYQLSHKGSPRILKWVAHPFSSGSSSPRNQTGVSCIAGGFFTSWERQANRI